MKAEIITIGDELLIGQVIDTNSAYLARLLNNIGISVYQITSVSDNQEHILQALNNTSDVQLVLITGGLGPTKDDITKKVLSEFTGDKLTVHHATLHHIEELMKVRNMNMNTLNSRQAEVLEHCTVIRNDCGTAPGMWFEKNGTVYISMPGVPFEMKLMMQEYIIPMLQDRLGSDIILHKTLLVSGIPESELAIMIEKWEDQLPSFIRLAYLPSGGVIRLRLSVFGTDKEFMNLETERIIAQLRPILGHHLLSEQDELPEELAGRLLAGSGKTVSTAESCTGGNVAHLLTSVSGSSGYFTGSIVAYSNQVKINQLRVNELDINQYGAVSEVVVSQMAENVRKLMNTDYGIATSGIAGPAGGTPDKPVGTIWIAVASQNQTITKLLRYGNIRENNIQRSSVAVLNLLTELIKKEQGQ